MDKITRIEIEFNIDAYKQLSSEEQGEQYPLLWRTINRIIHNSDENLVMGRGDRIVNK